MPGRLPKPTKLLELTGAFRKNPARKRAREGEPESAGSIGGPPPEWMIFHPDVGYQRAEKLRALWDNCIKLWPWLEFADRDALADYVELRLKKKENSGKLSGAEWSAYNRIRTELGGTGSGRARRGILSSPSGTKPPSAGDPRSAFLAKKYG